ncbi:amidase [Bordetella sp. BOR01]|uniref:amidase n=1 Tax=Bordetella sp. BOR01 TaxID=2854779 RepID=UPI001C496D46|nr:amidase [Bordetella sp. BOR01]MBV7482617.1 amidase [Bordetella sp. BOR01]
MSIAAPHEVSVHAIAQRVRAGLDDPLDTARHALQAIARREPDIHAWAHVESEAALAETARNMNRQGPLAGVPFGVKDIIDVAAMPTRCGSPATAATCAAFDAGSVGLLRAAGAVPLGKTVTTEFAFRRPGPTRNPHAPQHTPGGSSSGSAAAVAAGMVPLALGTQTGGSVIRPAAFCGVVGFKPSYAALLRDGMKVTCESLDVIGWYGQAVGDVDEVARVLLPYESDAAPKPVHSLRIAVFPYSPIQGLDPDGQAALQSAREKLAAHGVSCTLVPESPHMAALARAHAVIMEYEFARSLAPVARVHADKLSKNLLDTVKAGLAIPVRDYRDMRRLQARLRTDWHELAGDADLILTPSTPGAAPRGLGSTGSSAFNKIWSVLGWPCLHLPAGTTPDGLPIGVQLVANWNADAHLLAWGNDIHKLITEQGNLA